MALKLDIPQPEILKPKITIFGVGGAGGNAINNMIRSSLEGVEFVAANTDAQSLANSLAQNKIQLGVATTKGLGAGSFPDRGRAAAEENISEIESFLDGNNMVFIAAGMGGGTGTGAAPVIAKLAKERDILTVGVITKPFHFEGKYRMEAAQKGIEELKKHVDTLIVIPNQNLFRIANEHTTFESAFKMADDVLHAGVRGITDLITMPGLVNLDFADIRTIMTKMGKAMMGTGEAGGENRAIEACEAAISNPLLDDISIKGAKGVLVNMTGGPDMTLFEADLAVNTIKKEVDANANIIFGSAFNENMKGKIRISVVATGIDEEEYKQDILKTQQSFEPSKFRVNLEKQDAKSDTKKKSFFDPGKPAEPVTEVIEENFEESVVMSEPKSSDNTFFASNITEDDFEDLTVKAAPKIQPKIQPKEEIKQDVKLQKEQHSGFSLFNFMNNKKNDSSKIKKSQFDEDELFEKEEDETKTSAKQKHMRATEERTQEALKKKQEFFGSTIFDDEKDLDKSEKMDDDILNVPAFFRRKK